MSLFINIYSKYFQLILSDNLEIKFQMVSWPLGTSLEPCWSLLHLVSLWKEACSSGCFPEFPTVQKMPLFLQNAHLFDNYRINSRSGLFAYLLIPWSYNVFHVNIAGEKCYNPIRYNGRHFQKQVPIVPDHSCGGYGALTQLSTFWDSIKHKHSNSSTNQNLLWSQIWNSKPLDHCHAQQSEKMFRIFRFEISFKKNRFSLNGLLHTHKRTKAGTCQCHGKGSHGNGVEVQDSGIDFQWRKSLVRGNIRQTMKYMKLFHVSKLMILSALIHRFHKIGWVW